MLAIERDSVGEDESSRLGTVKLESQCAVNFINTLAESLVCRRAYLERPERNRTVTAEPCTVFRNCCECSEAFIGYSCPPNKQVQIVARLKRL